jgi:hypothetical protein
MGHKIDCTVISQDLFHVALVQMETSTNRDNNYPTEGSIDLVAKKLSEEPNFKVSIHSISSRIDQFSKTLNTLEQLKPQAVVLLTDLENIEELHQFAYQYNNTFHNSPNILFVQNQGVFTAEMYQNFPSFDLALKDSNVALIVDICRALHQREFATSPIDFQKLGNVLWRKNASE